MERKNTSQTDSQEREPYDAPKIVYREPLEAVATTCLPAPPSKGSPGACPIGPISS